MDLVIWTSAKVDVVKEVFGGALRSFRPDVPKHRFVGYTEGAIPEFNAGDHVMVCGKKCMTELQKLGYLPKGRGLETLRESPVTRDGVTFMVTYDPTTVANEPPNRDMIAWDLRLLVRLMRTGSLNPEVGKYQWVNSFQPVIDWVEKQFAKTGKGVDVSVDTETMGFYPWYPDKDIISISFTGEPHTAHVLYLGPQPPPIALDPSIPLFDQISFLLTSPKVKLRLANGKYDLIWIAEKWGIECTNFTFDTMLVGTLLDENRSNGLSNHVKTMTNMGGYDLLFDKQFDKSKMEEVPTAPLLTYAGGDTDGCQQVADVLRQELIEDPKLAKFYITILHPGARAFEKMERRGVVVDQQKFALLRQELTEAIDSATNTALGLLPNRLRIKYRDKIDDQLAKGKSPLVDALLKEFFFTPNGLNLKPRMWTEKTGQPSMAKSHLKQFADTPEAAAMVEALTQMDVASKARATFVDGFLAHLRPDGRLHPTYFLGHAEFDGYDEDSGTVTGRLSAKNPAFQIIPKKTYWAKKIRECYPAPPGMVVLQLDFSQGELRVVACVANEKNMIAAYEQGMDLHALTGSQLGGVPYDEFLTWKDNQDAKLAAMFEDFRQQAKAGNFGLLYGMGVEGFMAYAWANYGLKLTYPEAEKIRNDFFALYPGLTAYHERQREIVKFAAMVRSPLGRIRHLPTIRSWDRAVRSKAERQAINCVTEDTEILTPQGWKTVNDLKVGDAAFSVDPDTGMMWATPVLEIHRGTYTGRAWHIEHNAVSALCTPHHRWLVDTDGKPQVKFAQDLTMSGHDKLWVASEGMPPKTTTEWTDDEITLMGWVLTDGHYKRQHCPKTGKEWGLGRVGVTQTKPQNIGELDALFTRLGKHSRQVRKSGQHVWEITTPATRRMREMMPDKTLTARVLMSMSSEQHALLLAAMLRGGGSWDAQANRYRKFTAGTQAQADAFMMLCALLGLPCRAVERDYSSYTPKAYASMGNVPKAGKCWVVELPKSKRAQPQYKSEWVDWSGDVWCPSLMFGTWVAKRNGKVFVTGNSPIQSTLTDMMVWSIALLEDAYPNSALQIVGMIHDSMIAYVPENEAQIWAARCSEVMSNLPFHELGWNPVLKFPADAEAGPTLARLTKIKL
mgnify:CR=1 FL=1